MAIINSVNRYANIIGRCARYTYSTTYGYVDMRYHNVNDKMFTWDNNDTIYTKSLKQRLRQLRNPNWITTRYLWPTVLRATESGSNGTPLQSYMEDKWVNVKGRTLEDLYVHTAVPEGAGNRASWLFDASFLYVKFADPDYLDILFGPSGAEGTGSWVESNYPTSYFNGNTSNPVDYYAHDVFATYQPLNYGYPAPPIGKESEYCYGFSATASLIGSRWYEYMSAFRSRILEPLGRKVIVNLAYMRHHYHVPGLVDVPYIDTDYMALFDGIFMETMIRKADPWVETWDYHWGLGTKLFYFRKLLDAGKSIATAYAGEQIYALRLYNKGTVGARTYTVNGNSLDLQEQNGSTLSVTLTDYASLTALAAYIRANSTSFNADVYGQNPPDSDGATWYTEAPPNLAITASTSVAQGAWTTFSIAPLSPKLQTAPRDYMVTLLAYFMLLGVRSTDKVFVGYDIFSMSAVTPSHHDVHDLLHLLGNPDSRQTTWEKVNAGWGDVYYRHYENGVVFFNWEAEGTGARTINASQFGQASWYPVRNCIYTPGETWNTAASISLAPKRGEICIFSL